MFFNSSLIKKIEKAGLIGRGCNNFPTAKKWRLVRQAKTKAGKFVVCNASESEPGVFKDRYILEHWPERVIDGIKLAMKAVGAKKGFIYLNPEYYDKFQARLQKIAGSKKIRIELYEKPLHDYVGGEETAVINSMEGKRVEPRMKPPFPTTNGFFDQPTLVNNCETFHAVSLIKSNEYKNTRFYCVSGDDIKPAVKELPVDISIRKALQEFGHKPNEDYFYQVSGGAAGNVLNHKQLARKFNGLASIIVYHSSRTEKNVVMQWLDFFANESCGQCVPCREGTFRLRNMMENYFHDKKSIDMKLLKDLLFTLQNTCLCPLGKVSANAMLSYFKNVRGLNLFEGDPSAKLGAGGEKCDIK